MLDRVIGASNTYTPQHDQETLKEASSFMGKDAKKATGIEPFLHVEESLINYFIQQKPIYTRCVKELDLESLKCFNEALSTTREHVNLKKVIEQTYLKNLRNKVKRLRSDCRKVYLAEYGYNKRPKTSTAGEMREPAKKMVKELLTPKSKTICDHFSHIKSYHFRHTDPYQVKKEMIPLLEMVGDK